MRRGTVGLMVALGCASSTPAPKTADYVVKLNEQYGHLKNGVKVILLPDMSSPLVHVDVRYRVGSKEDPRGKAGLAHLVEHLLFQHRPAPDQPSLGAALRRSSIYMNASTTWDYTHYTTLARADDLAAVVIIEAVRLASGCEGIPPDIFEREREVVRNELRQRDGDPEGRLLWKLHELVYGSDHAYGRNIGGDDAQVSALTLDDVCNFVRDYYVPERATVVIAGHFAEKQAQALLAQHFGGIPARPGAALAEVTPIKLDGRRETVELEIDRDAVVVVWPLPPSFGNDSFADDFMDSVLIHGAGEVFYDEADDVVIGQIGGPQAPALVAQVTLKKGASASKTGWALLNAADGAHVGVADARAAPIRAQLLGDLAATFENLGARAEIYAEFAQFEPGSTFKTLVDRLAKLDSSRIKDLADRYLDRSRGMIVMVKPRPGAAGARAARFASLEDQAPDELPVDPRDAARPIPLPAQPTGTAHARRFELDNGMKVVLLETRAPIPVVTAKLTFAAGSAHEPSGKRGLATLVGWAYANRVRTTLFDFRADVVPDSTTITGRTASIHTHLMIDAFSVFEDDFRSNVTPVRAMQRGLKGALLRRAVKRYAAMSSTVGKAVFGETHPYATALDPFAGANVDADQGDLEKFMKAHFRAANATLIVAGVFEMESVEQHIRKRFGGWQRGTVTPVVADPPRSAAGPVAYAIAGADDAPLVEAVVAWATPAGMGKGHAARLVLAEILSRRVAAVRERLGASYGVYASYQPARGPGVVSIGGAVDAARAAQALAAARSAVDDVRRGENLLEDFVRARATVLAELLANASDSASLARRLATIAAFGLAPTFYDDLAHEVARLSPSDVLALARAELAPSGEVIVAEGSRSALQRMFVELKLTPRDTGAAKR